MIYKVSPTTITESAQESISYMDIAWFDDKQAQEVLQHFFIGSTTKNLQNSQVIKS